MRVKPSHIHLKEKHKEPVTEPVALNLMKPHRNHLNELVRGDVIEGQLESEYCVKYGVQRNPLHSPDQGQFSGAWEG